MYKGRTKGLIIEKEVVGDLFCDYMDGEISNYYIREKTKNGFADYVVDKESIKEVEQE